LLLPPLLPPLPPKLAKLLAVEVELLPVAEAEVLEDEVALTGFGLKAPQGLLTRQSFAHWLLFCPHAVTHWLPNS